MKKRIKWEKSSLEEALFEIIVAIIFFGVGFLVLKLFGVDAVEKDFEMVALVGFAVLIGLPILGYFVVRLIKKKSTKVDGVKNDTGNNR